MLLLSFERNSAKLNLYNNFGSLGIVRPRYTKWSLTNLNVIFSKKPGLYVSESSIKLLFDRLIVYPDNLPKEVINSKRTGTEFPEFLKYNITSSAYRLIRASLPPTSRPVLSLWCLIHMARGSIAIAKRAGERGQPCCTERCKGNVDDLSVFVKIEHTGLAYINLTKYSQI